VNETFKIQLFECVGPGQSDLCNVTCTPIASERTTEHSFLKKKTVFSVESVPRNHNRAQSEDGKNSMWRRGRIPTP
jgi:hypothetical protein